MKTARWIRRTHLFRADEYVCSSCRRVSDAPYNVCPRCGSPMKKAKGDASWVDEAEMFSAIFDDDRQ